MRAQIADTALDVQLAVWPNRQQPIVAGGSRGMCADGDADTPHFAAVLLPGARRAFLPVEALGSAIERLLDESTRRVPALAVPRRAEWRFAGGCVDLPHFHLIDAELDRSLRN